jgi:hypothetical protein
MTKEVIKLALDAGNFDCASFDSAQVGEAQSTNVSRRAFRLDDVAHDGVVMAARPWLEFSEMDLYWPGRPDVVIFWSQFFL